MVEDKFFRIDKGPENIAESTERMGGLVNRID